MRDRHRTPRPAEDPSANAPGSALGSSLHARAWEADTGFRLSLAGLLAAAAAATVLSGCATARIANHPAPLAATALPDQPVALAASRDARWPDEAWWRALDDPQLDTLMATALERAPSLAMAHARVAHAAGLAGEARAGEGPSISASETTSRARISESGLAPPVYGGTWTTNAAVGVDLSWALDLWGGARNQTRAAQANAEAARLDEAAARLTLTTVIARTYAGLARAHNRLEIANARVTRASEALDLARQRDAAGLEASVQRARATLADARRDADAQALAVQTIQLQLAGLAGLMPEAGLAIARPRLELPESLGLPSSLPADLLARRPDVAAALARVTAAQRSEDAARSAFYPNINLAASIGAQSLGLDRLFDPGSLTPSLGPAIHLPLFNGGRLQARLDEEAANTDAAIAAYDEAVLAAMRDVALAHARLAALTRQTEEARTALDAATRQLANAQAREVRGIASRLDTLVFEDNRTTALTALTDVTAARLEAAIDLIGALGGGWQSTQPEGPIQ